MEKAPAFACGMLEDHDDADDLESSRRRASAASARHQGDEQNLREGRPKTESGPADLVDMIQNKATAAAVGVNFEGSDGGPLPGEPGNPNKRREDLN